MVVLGFVATYFAFKNFETIIGISILVISLLILIFFVKRYLKLSEERKYYRRILLINQNESKALDFDFSEFDDGREFAEK